jgi:cyclomaltodextrinase / maltogenic alpha-amylase / neopullulanase
MPNRFCRTLAFVLTCAISTVVGGCAAPRSPASSTTHPECSPPPAIAPLFLRGTMTTWALRDDLQFQYRCDAYVLNVNLTGAHTFRITDARFSGGTSFGTSSQRELTLQPDQPAPIAEHGHGNLRFEFHGAHTIRIAPAANGANAQITIIAGTAGPAEAVITNPIAQSLKFDSRDSADKTPFGAQPMGTEVAFNLDALPGVSAVMLVVDERRLEGPQEVLEYREAARVPLARIVDGAREHWHGHYRFDEIGVFGYYFIVEIGGVKYRYENNADTIYWTRELGSNGLGRTTRGSEDAPIRRFRQTIYRADYRVPDWAKDAVFYYIFPERFRNGDRSNDPRPGPGTFRDASVEVHTNWLDAPWSPHSGDGSDDLYGNDFFGGDLAGIIEKLDYIHELGANALYLTPIFRAASNHKYDTADYRNIDPHFGTNAEFDKLTRAAKKRGIRVILDTSLNHSGSDSIYFDRYAKYPGLGAFDGGHIQAESPYANWYHFDASQSEPDLQYRGWAGAKDLPELDKASASYRAFAFGAADSLMNLWLDRGASGWRMDVAPWIPDDFWRAWRAAVKTHRPDALTIAETQFEASKFLLGDEFDSTMNYVFRNAVQDYAAGGDARVDYRNIELMRELYPPQAFYALMNLLSTHDSARALYEFGWHAEHDSAQTIALAKQRLRLAAFFQMTFPGAPAVFYGDEAGVTGGEDPFNRVTYPWPDLGGKPDQALLAEYKQLIGLRNTHAVLRHGSIDAPVYIDAHVIVLLRHDGSHWAITATNNDAVPHEVAVPLPADLADVQFTYTFGGAHVRARGRALSFTVPALFGTMLEDSVR